jgi:hypothetical protein
MIRRRRRQPHAVADLPIEYIDALLDDFPAADAIDERRYDVFARFDLTLHQQAELRVMYRDALIQEAIRRGLGGDHVDRVAADKDDAPWLRQAP